MSGDKVKTIRIIPSKSFAHRAYICDFLAGENACGVISDLYSDDINATKGCLAGLSSGVEVIDAMESGSTLRFILPLAGVLGRSVSIITRGRLKERPMNSFESELMRNGMRIQHGSDGVIRTSGRLEPGVYRLPGSISSQFITGLLLSLPYLDGDSRIELTSELKSKAYVDITLSVLADYGVEISEHDGAYDIKGGQKFECSGAYKVEGDWSQAAFWLVAGLIGKTPVRVEGLKPDSVQGDREIVEILKRMGGRIEEKPDDDYAAYTSYPSDLHGTVADVSEIPDLAPAIACAAAACEDKTRMIKAERLRLKESDRIDSIVNCLTDLGFSASSGEGEIVIGGRKEKSGESSDEIAKARTAGDHRVVMMAAVLSLITDEIVEIEESSSVTKSYPTFFDELEQAGLSDNLIRS